MAAIRILVVDDSVVVRKLLTSALGEVKDLEVVATAALGTIALAKIPQVNPDIVILDVEMPEMDGLETLRRIKKQWPKLPVIMFSTRTEQGAAATIEALTCGAADYVAKPSNVGNVTVALTRVREEMVPKLRALALHGSMTIPIPKLSLPPTSTQVLPVMRPRAPLGPPRAPVELVAIGASTGGPNALAILLSALPATLPVPVVIVQHMLPTFTQHFAARLAAQSQLTVVEATNGERLVPGHAYIARGDYHLQIDRRAGNGYVQLDQGTPENFCRPAVDVLFRSAARTYGAATLGVVLTGMGQDGCTGAGLIQDAGGNVIVQDERSSVVWGMPGFVARAGLANEVLPLPMLATSIVDRVTRGRIASVERA